jgi:hypothetical protein
LKALSLKPTPIIKLPPENMNSIYIVIALPLIELGTAFFHRKTSPLGSSK